jgi:hypothetical protein
MRKVTYAVLALSVIIQLAAVSVSPARYFLHLHSDEKVQFTVIQAPGVPSIIEPPTATYFNWRKSPIVAQFEFIREISYELLTNNSYVLDNEKVKASPKDYLFDFWWFCKYVAERNSRSLVMALLFLGIIIYISTITYKSVRLDK